MKITRANEVVPYEPAGHYDMRASRVHSAAMSGSAQLTLGLSWFLPGGGAQRAKVNDGMELIYYITEGQLTLTTETETTVLEAGDSCFFKAGDVRSVKNESARPAAMLVIMAKRP